MRYGKAKDLTESDFKRLYGVQEETFVTMCEVVTEVDSRETRGRKSAPLRGYEKICVNGNHQHLFLMEDFYADYQHSFTTLKDDEKPEDLLSADGLIRQLLVKKSSEFNC